MTWFTEFREQWIKESVEIFGMINRAHIMHKFEVSSPQASIDLQRVLSRWPNLMKYNTSTKQYERLEG